MRRVTRSMPLLGLPLALSLVLVGGCREPHTPKGKTPKTEGGAAEAVALPDPLPLPAEPRVVSWIAEPSVAISMLAPYSPQPLDLRALAEQALAGLTEAGLAAELAAAIDTRAPFSNVLLDDGQEVIRVSLSDAARPELATRLAALEPVGEFGAARLPRRMSEDGGEVQRAGAREWLAWIDEADGGTLVLANSLEGLVTGRELADAYGGQPIFFSVDLDAALAQLPMPVDVPFSRVSGRGDLNEVVIDVQALPDRDPLAELPIATGTLGGLLAAPGVAAGASGRYADYDQTVRDITAEVNANVRELPFLVRGVAEDLAAKFNTLLRTWDGRTLVAIGPANHVRIAYGAGDVKKSEVAMIRLLQKIVDSTSLARNFMARVPKISLRRRVAKADGHDIELLVLYEAFSTVPPELRGLVDGESRLNVALAWPARAGGGMIVIGPDAVAELEAWIEQTASAPDHSATSEELMAARFAGDPAQLQSLLAAGQQLDIAKLLSLAPSGPTWSVNVTPKGRSRYEIRVRTPGPPKVARAR